MENTTEPLEGDDEYFYTKYITNKKTGKRIYAASYGLKAFRIKRKPKKKK